MIKSPNQIQLIFIVLFIILAGVYRILPHPYNFSPVGAMALFGGTYFANKYLGIVVPLITLWISDLIINNIIFTQFFPTFTWFYGGFYWVYGSFILVGCVGWFLKDNVKFWTIPLACLTGSVLFFVFTNFGVWATGSMYPLTLQGLVMCYTAAIPFFGPTILGDILFVVLFFGAFELLKSKTQSMQQATI